MAEGLAEGIRLVGAGEKGEGVGELSSVARFVYGGEGFFGDGDLDGQGLVGSSSYPMEAAQTDIRHGVFGGIFDIELEHILRFFVSLIEHVNKIFSVPIIEGGSDDF